MDDVVICDDFERTDVGPNWVTPPAAHARPSSPFPPIEMFPFTITTGALVGHMDPTDNYEQWSISRWADPVTGDQWVEATVNNMFGAFNASGHLPTNCIVGLELRASSTDASSYAVEFWNSASVAAGVCEISSNVIRYDADGTAHYLADTGGYYASTIPVADNPTWTFRFESGTDGTLAYSINGDLAGGVTDSVLVDQTGAGVSMWWYEWEPGSTSPRIEQVCFSTVAAGRGRVSTGIILVGL